MKGRRLWLKIAWLEGTIPVFVSRGPLLVDGCEVDGYFDTEKTSIVIRSMDNVVAMKAKLHHELLHVCFSAHSGDALSFMGRTQEARDKKEEDVISFLGPVQFDLLVRNGFLKYPNPPRFK